MHIHGTCISNDFGLFHEFGKKNVNTKLQKERIAQVFLSPLETKHLVFATLTHINKMDRLQETLLFLRQYNP